MRPFHGASFILNFKWKVLKIKRKYAAVSVWCVKSPFTSFVVPDLSCAALNQNGSGTAWCSGLDPELAGSKENI